MFSRLKRKLKINIFSLIAVVLLINFTLIFISYSYIMKNDYNQKVIHICEKSTEYISLKLKSIEDTAHAFSKDTNLMSAIYTYNTYVIKTISELKTVNEDIESAFVISSNQSYYYDPSDKGRFSDLFVSGEKYDDFADGKWIIYNDDLIYVCGIYDSDEIMGLLGFRLHNKLFLPVFEDYSNYFLQDVEAVIFNRNLQYKIFGNPDSGRIENYLKNSDEDISENTEGIFYKSDYDKDLDIMIITSGKQINKVLMTLFLILLIIMIAAYFLLYIVLKRYLDFVTGRLGALCMKMHDFSGNAEETEEA